MLRKNYNFINLLIYFMCISILIDCINGYLIFNDVDYSISRLYRCILLILIYSYLFIKLKILIILNTVFAIIFYMIYFTAINIKLECMDWLIKFIIIVVSYELGKILIKNGKKKSILKIIKISFFILLINFMLGFFGFGFSMYGTSIGTSGFIFAGNEIGVLVVILGAILLMHHITNNNFKMFFIILFCMFFMSAMLTSKVSILATIIIGYFFVSIKFFDSIRNNKIDKKIFSYALLMCTVISILLPCVLYYVLFEQNLLSRLLYFYNRIDLVTLFFSHRNIWAYDSAMIYINNYSFIEKIFGSGFGANSSNIKEIVEIDVVDFLMYYGFFGVIIVFIFLMLVFFKTNKYNPLRYYLFVSYFLIILISLTAGHVFNSGVSGLYLGLLFSFSNIRNGKTCLK